MTDFARRLVKSLQRHEAVAEPVAEASLTLIEVSLAGSATFDVEDFEAVLRTDVERLVRESGVDPGGVSSMTVRFDGTGALEFSVGGRPVIRLPSAVEGRTAVQTAHACARYLHRRLPLLSGHRQSVADIQRYLLAVGCAWSEAEGPRAGEDAERILNDRIAQAIVVDVSASAMRRESAEGRKAVARLRDAEFREYGVRYPELRIEINDSEEDVVCFRFNDMTTAPFDLGAGADWSAVVAQLQRELAVRRHWFLTVDAVEQSLSTLVYLYPELVRAAAVYPLTTLTGCLRELLRGGGHITNIPRILWLLLGQAAAPDEADVVTLSDPLLLPGAVHHDIVGMDPITLASGVRKLAIEEMWRLGTLPSEVLARLDAGLEDRLVHARTPDEIGAAEWDAVRAVSDHPGTTMVVTRTVGAIDPVRDALQAVMNPPRVIASQELPPDVDLAAYVSLGCPPGADRPG